MARLSVISVLLLAPLASLVGAPVDPLPALVPTAVLADPVNNPDWRDLFAVLGQPKTRVSRFEERRYFPFRQAPIILKGEIRISPQRGLSLHYFTPKPQTVIVDQAGVLLRDGNGRERSAPADSRAQAATSGLFKVLRFDLPSLAADFDVHGQRTADAWTLGFVPRDAKLRALIGAVVVRGGGSRVQRIDLLRSDKQRIEIRIESTLDDVIFPVDVVKEFFR